jgi:hypothetical protein
VITACTSMHFTQETEVLTCGNVLKAWLGGGRTRTHSLTMLSCPAGAVRCNLSRYFASATTDSSVSMILSYGAFVTKL